MLILCACTLPRNVEYKSSITNYPSQWEELANVDNLIKSELTENWWEIYNINELNNFINIALQSNLEIETSLRKINLAELAVNNSEANLFPLININAQSKKSKYSNSNLSPINESGINLTADYSMSLWSDTIRDIDSKNRLGLASKLEAVHLRTLIVAATIKAYFSVQIALNEIALAESTESFARQQLKIAKIRYEQGHESDLEIQHLVDTLNETKVNLIKMQQAYRSSLRALDLLLGRISGTTKVTEINLLSVRIPLIEINPPVAVLGRRADLAAIEARLNDNDDAVMRAKEALYPLKLSFNLSASQQGTLIGGGAFISNGNTGSIALNFARTIFDHGVLSNGVKEAEIQRDQALADWKKAIFVLINDAEEKIGSYVINKKQDEFELNKLNTSKKYFDLAQLRYNNGIDDQLTLHKAALVLSTAENSAAKQRVATLQTAADLFIAMGIGQLPLSSPRIGK